MLTKKWVGRTEEYIRNAPKNEDNTRAMITFKNRRETVVGVITNDKKKEKKKQSQRSVSLSFVLKDSKMNKSIQYPGNNVARRQWSEAQREHSNAPNNQTILDVRINIRKNDECIYITNISTHLS